jgi:hypothetical protein
MLPQDFDIDALSEEDKKLASELLLQLETVEKFYRIRELELMPKQQILFDEIKKVKE